ncbi:tRNA (adenosine(37)-N6)-threonylcarbamoyltransferase complex dimerization subunit type 1 TsaB [Paenibacillus sp. 1P07SE]|uniref:tRNA (adenosine(37)-N6)-threonylcarbamoyltransferase complex dimerization subunit type 1 TsaB n=1 Tax=Paenibacillus sp. 1P07SE TaxID=3132209 RepID=UPI0039A63E9C
MNLHDGLKSGLHLYEPGSDEPLVLAFDTATAAFAAALLQGDRILGGVQSLAERNHSVNIIPQLQQLLRETGAGGEALTGLAVGIGPGSYTGVRIAVTAAKTLAWVWDKPLVGVSSLELLALGGGPLGHAEGAEPGDEAWVVPLMDARRGQVYTALFDAAPSGWSRLAEDQIRLMSDWRGELIRRLEAAGDHTGEGLPARLRFTGDPALHLEEIGLLEQELADRYPDLRLEVRPHVAEGRWAALLGSVRLLAGEQDTAHDLVPNYTQLAEAEAKLQARLREGS